MADVQYIRLIDANANRAREGIRTAEDFIRFLAGDSRWAPRLKGCRAKISELISKCFDTRVLVASRNSTQDPLRPEAAIAESSAQAEPRWAVAQRGLKRAQEALRVMEENLRGEFPAESKGLEQIRYQLYDAEQWIVNGSHAAGVLNSAKVYVILSEALCSKGLLGTAEAVFKGGAKVVQLREKGSGQDRALLTQARDLRKLCQNYDAVLFCNDRIDIALAAQAEGVHLGQGDLSLPDARQLCGDKLLIGLSTHTVEQAKQAVLEGPDYIAIGSMYETTTKAGRILAGLELARQVSSLNLQLPVFAIGGIKLDRVGELKQAGVKRIAVSTAIISQSDPQAATQRFVEAMAG